MTRGEIHGLMGWNSLCECAFQGKKCRGFLRQKMLSENLNLFAKEEFSLITLNIGTVVLAYYSENPESLSDSR